MIARLWLFAGSSSYVSAAMGIVSVPPLAVVADVEVDDEECEVHPVISRAAAAAIAPKRTALVMVDKADPFVEEPVEPFRRAPS